MDYIYPTGGYYGYRYPYGDFSSGIMNQFLTYYSGTYLSLSFAYNEEITGPGAQTIEHWISYVVDTGQVAAITGAEVPITNYVFPGYYNIGLTQSQSGIYSMVWGSGQPDPSNINPPLNDPGGSED